MLLTLRIKVVYWRLFAYYGILPPLLDLTKTQGTENHQTDNRLHDRRMFSAKLR